MDLVHDDYAITILIKSSNQHVLGRETNTVWVKLVVKGGEGEGAVGLVDNVPRS